MMPTRGTCLRADLDTRIDPETGLPFGWIFADDTARAAAIARQLHNPQKDAMMRQLGVELAEFVRASSPAPREKRVGFFDGPSSGRYIRT